jgi:predicted RNA binding protein YcfA (HicA-like mRNA interferase family)
MSKNLTNWTYKEVTEVLREHGFVLNHTRGSHYYFRGYAGKIPRQVCVPYHGNNASLKPRTFKGIMVQSGLPKEIWLNEKR